MLRIATYNVEWFFVQEHGRALMFNLKLCPIQDKAKKLAQKILSLPPLDVVCLQEVQDEQALQLLCRELGKEWRCVSGRFASSRTDQRVGLVYSTRMVDMVEHDSYVSTAGMQKNQWVRVRSADKHFCIVNVHLKSSWDDVSISERRQEAKVLLSLVTMLRERFPEDAVIVCGDFNDLDTDFETPTPPRVYSSVLKQIKDTCQLQNTVMESIPVKDRISNKWLDCIDHILIDDKCQLADAAAIYPDANVSDDQSERISDHFPLVATIKLKQ